MLDTDVIASKRRLRRIEFMSLWGYIVVDRDPHGVSSLGPGELRLLDIQQR